MPAPFTGFGEKALPFFKALDFHMSREWFQENRALYDSDVLAPFSALIEAVNADAIARGLPMRGTPKSALFRIHRDVRFSKDKRPYKTHAGAVMTRSGAKNDQGLTYIHISPEGCFAAVGFYDLEPKQLAAFRQAIIAAQERFRAMSASLAAAGLTFDPQWSLKRPPREAAGIEAADLVAALKLKSIVVKRPLPDALIRSPELVGTVIGLIEDALPLLDFGWSALAVLEPERG
ncbi:TIGR02453 family protein [Labrys neptuniae]